MSGFEIYQFAVITIAFILLLGNGAQNMSEGKTFEGGFELVVCALLTFAVPL